MFRQAVSYVTKELMQDQAAARVGDDGKELQRGKPVYLQ